jgi:transcriptional regulator with XRE-family HTH domain
MTSKELQAWRKKKGYTQGQLAKVLGVATQTVYRWENYKRAIPSFLHLTLECLEKKGGEKKAKGKKTKKEVRK